MEIFPDYFGICCMDKAVNIFTDQRQVVVFVCAAKVSWPLVVAVNSSNLQLFSCYRTFANVIKLKSQVK